MMDVSAQKFSTPRAGSAWVRWVGSGTFAQVSDLLLLTMVSYESALS